MTEQITENQPADDEAGDFDTIRAKWTMDDATTLAEAAAKLRERADELDQMHREGWTLDGPISDDWGFLVPPAKKA
jgi:hypothetical protein